MKDTLERKIQDYFNGQLSAAEEAEIVEWLKLKEKNREHFQHLKANLDPQHIIHPFMDASFAELQNKLFINQQFNNKISGHFRKIQLSLLRMAAILLVALITGFSMAYMILRTNPSKAEVVWFVTHVSRGEKSQLLLPDGSRVWINSESNISYPSNFMDGNRQIKLNGEAYFEVSKLDGKTFTVQTKDYDIHVLGTKFNVMAYSDFDRTETALLEGKIEIQKGERVIPVSPGQEITFKHNQFSIEDTNTNLSTKWKDDIFEFDHITFKELVVRLERWYDVDIRINTPGLNEILYSGVFKNEETIWQVLNTLQHSHPIRYTRVGFRNFEIKMTK